MKEMACRRCRTLTNEKVCRNCGNTEFSNERPGLIIVLNPAESQVAKTLGITKPGRYALKVS